MIQPTDRESSSANRLPPRCRGEQTDESLAHNGDIMNTAAMVTYAYDQIDQARTELERCLEMDDI